jgi:arsenite-transporting ATPase
MVRIIICSGSGGSGVTTLAAATAVAAAATGKATLAYGLNSGLLNAFDLPLRASPVKVAENLHAHEGHQRRESTDEFREWMAVLLEWRGMDVELADDLAALPGMNHVGRLLELESHIDSGEYDVVVVDAAPLAQFLDLPPALDASARWLARLFAPRQANVFEPFLRVFAAEYASAGEDVLEQGQQLLGRLAALRDLFTEAGVTTVRLVLPPEIDAVRVARHAATALGLFAYPLDAFVVNRLLPEVVTDPFFNSARDRQAEGVVKLREAVHPLPVLEMELEREPARGTQAFEGLAARVYGPNDPLAVLHEAPARSVSKNGAGYELKIPLPLAERDQLDLEETDDGVAVHLDGRRCVLPLPDEARYYDRASWSLERGVLKVVFER